MKHKTTFILGTLAASLLGTSTVAAQEAAKGFSLNRFQPSERGSDWFVTDSLDFRGSGRLALGVVGDWAHRPLVVYDENGDFARAPISNQLVLHLGGAIVVADRVRFAASLPVYAVNRGAPGTVNGVAYGMDGADEGANVGDVRLGFDVRLFGTYGDAFSTALGLQAHLPTGSEDAYTGDGKARLVPHWLMAGDLGPLAYATQLGLDGRFRMDNFAGQAFGPEMTFGASAGLRVADKKVLIGPELSGSTVISDGGGGFFKKRTTPVELLFGAHARVGDFQLGGGAGPGLSRGVGTPDVRVVASLGWFPEPAKPEEPPPPPPDRDGDGILDRDDACPDDPGPASDDPAKHGCPLPKDSDGDGITDDKDACPDVPGVASEDPKLNGCPPPDRDKDGILDDDDACPDEPGKKHEDPKKNGCPPPKDSDGDGITDDVDACVHDKGPANDDPKKHGCPKVVVVAGEVKILERIEFDTGKATIRPESDGILKAVADTLTKHSELTKLEVQGHTDNRGSKALNKRLSQQRAASVVKWLVANGIDPKRLAPKGFGQEQPIDSNDSDSGRQNNRRVQFIILEKKGGSDSVKTDSSRDSGL